jgi:hypothetical protein
MHKIKEYYFFKDCIIFEELLSYKISRQGKAIPVTGREVP